MYSAGGYSVQQLLQPHDTDTRPPRYGLRDTDRSVCNLYTAVSPILLTLLCPLSSLSHSPLSFCDFTKADLQKTRAAATLMNSFKWGMKVQETRLPFTVEGRPPANNSAIVRIQLLQIAKTWDSQTRFYCSCDLDLDPMTLIYKPDWKFGRCSRIPKINFICRQGRI